MSSVLDALRRGRGHPAPPSGESAQTDAVLHTLGYRQAGQATPLSESPRAIAILVAAAIILVWMFVEFVGVR